MEANTTTTGGTPSTSFTNSLMDEIPTASDNLDNGKPSKYEISPWAYEYDVNAIYLGMMFIMSGKCAVYNLNFKDLKINPKDCH